MIYLDNAATTYPKPEVVYKAIDFGMKNYSFNSGRGSYTSAKNVYKMIQDTREKIGKKVGVSGERVIFTSSATESLNNIIFGIGLKENDYVYVSPFEHNAVVRTLYSIGVNICIIPFDKQTWEVDKNKLNDMFLIKQPKAVIISHISNVLGFELPYESIFKLSKEFNAINVLDSAQGFGIYDINSVNVDYIVFAGHKSLYASFGAAGYIKLGKDDLNIVKVGGTGSDSLNPNMPMNMPNRYEAGSLNSVAIYSINQSLDYLSKNSFGKEKEKLANYLITNLKLLPNVHVFFPDNMVNKGIVSFVVDGYSSEDVGTILSEDFDVCVRTGYHCAPYVHEFIGSMNYSGTVRVSLGIFNKKEDIDALIGALKGVV